MSIDSEIENFLVLDNIDLLKFKANYEILKNETKEIYQATAKLHSEPDISESATSSIYKLGPIINRPFGHPEWFIAGYPDVVNYFSLLEEHKMENIFGAVSKNEVLNENGKFKIPFLRKIVDMYKKSGNKFEVGR